MIWLAEYHYIFVHFPIALIVMAGVAELLMAIRRGLPLDTTVTFLLVSAAVFLLPTIATGLILEESIGKQNHLNLELHETFAFITLALVFVVLFVRFWRPKHLLYYLTLTLLVVCVLVTAHFGGTMAFGSFHYLPSF